MHGLGLLDWADRTFEWASDEPTINRYTKKGSFAPHEDGFALTVVVPLSEPRAFDGGGTRFYQDVGAAPAPEEPTGRASTLLLESQGTAIIFDGDVTHAGASVTRGARHVWVGSFDLAPKAQQTPLDPSTGQSPEVG
jgi:predicted 2-oxoglutarate/Fe(II)-dependent dioxygenase YbiX